MSEEHTKDLGYANGWKVTPEIVQNCRKLRHRLTERTVGRCDNEYACKICKYKYNVDSSD